mmetsp:Transcript_11419/g.47841  ORF Transcript_11419/g.47841 Transcript_11419/m.47841 type:complete len:203 (+) Transcript_11419:1238-1846(+)
MRACRRATREPRRTCGPMRRTLRRCTRAARSGHVRASTRAPRRPKDLMRPTETRPDVLVRWTRTLWVRWQSQRAQRVRRSTPRLRCCPRCPRGAPWAPSSCRCPRAPTVPRRCALRWRSCGPRQRTPPHQRSSWCPGRSMARPEGLLAPAAARARVRDRARAESGATARRASTPAPISAHPPLGSVRRSRVARARRARGARR